MIKAIETRYKGYRFRSRLEARWAVFFDAMRWNWEYEPEGFDLGNGIAYLPDFKVFGEDSNGDYNVFYFEVKHREKDLSEKEKNKILAFANLCIDENLTKGYGDFILLDGPPDNICYYSAWYAVGGSIDREPLAWCMDVVYRYGRPTFEYCINYTKDQIKNRIIIYIDVQHFFKNIGYIGTSPVDKARSARFEHGECG